MKKLILCVSLVSAIFALSGCATTNSGAAAPLMTPQQFVAQFCPIATALNTSLVNTPGVDPQLVAGIKEIQPIVAGVCTAGASLKSTDLQSLLTDAIPVLLTAVPKLAIANSPEGQAILTGLIVAQAVLPSVIATLPAPAIK
jgi:hypothetical protein